MPCIKKSSFRVLLRSISVWMHWRFSSHLIVFNFFFNLQNDCIHSNGRKWSINVYIFLPPIYFYPLYTEFFSTLFCWLDFLKIEELKIFDEYFTHLFSLKISQLQIKFQKLQVVFHNCCFLNISTLRWVKKNKLSIEIILSIFTSGKYKY